MAYYTYLLRCGDGSLYTGITTDLRRRLAQHRGQGGKGARYTAAHPPVGLEAAWASPGRAGASRLEYRLKALTKGEKEGLLRGRVPPRLDLSPHPRIPITQEGEILMLFLCYPGCTTCQRAGKFLDAQGAAYVFRNIKTEPPTLEELRGWHAKSGLPLKKFFNTSGQLYRSLGLAARLPAMSEEEQLALLATDGMLVKRPLLVGETFVLAGFREEAWHPLLTDK